MFTALLSFLGGSAFRAIWGEISSFVNKRQDHAQELERLRLQAKHDAEIHQRNLEALKLQHDMGVQIIRVQGEADVARVEADAWNEAVKSVGGKSGIWIVDLWNGIIRPMLATICTALVVLHFYRAGWTLDDNGWSLVGAVLGIYVADRTLYKRAK
jgi:hypothetical protein